MTGSRLLSLSVMLARLAHASGHLLPLSHDQAEHYRRSPRVLRRLSLPRTPGRPINHECIHVHVVSIQKPSANASFLSSSPAETLDAAVPSNSAAALLHRRRRQVTELRSALVKPPCPSFLFFLHSVAHRALPDLAGCPSPPFHVTHRPQSALASAFCPG